ncbi:MAG: response regulator [Actinomycetota bacterium]
MKILVVDDSSVMRKLVSRSIRQAGYPDADVIEAENGKEALDIATSAMPDVILADWNMPVMTGIEMLRALNKEAGGLAVGFITSESTDEIKQQAESAGAAFFLSKPIDVDDLSDALQAVIA